MIDGFAPDETSFSPWMNELAMVQY